jgi:hypothetical protein
MSASTRITSKQAVIRADRSPLNPKRWCLTLQCGHETWVTSNARPSRAHANCETCADRARAMLIEAERSDGMQTYDRIKEQHANRPEAKYDKS